MINYLQVENLTKSYGDLVLFDNISFTIGEGQRIALIGRNGSGKTTLLNILAGKDTADSGTITPRRDLRIAYLEQNPEYAADLTVLEACFRSDNPALRAIAAYEQAVADPAQDGLQEAMSRMDALAAWDYEQRAKEILSRLKINDFDKKIGQLSGGQLKRVALAAVLISEADLLILDEPTNHLDTDMTEWLEEYLTRNKAALLMVTHDRYFLDNVTGWILELDRGQGIPYEGNYSSWLEQKRKRLEQEEKEETARQRTLASELEWIRKNPKARQAKSKARINAYDELLQAAAKDKITTANINIPMTERLGDLVIEAEHITKGYGDRILIDDLSFKIPKGAIVGIIGPNGAGKTTLFRMITGQEKPDSGTIRIGDTVDLGYVDQSRDELNPDKNVWEEISDGLDMITLGKKEFPSRAYVGQFNFKGGDQQKKVGQLSGGERNRVHLAKMLRKGANVILLDEPTNDLDVDTLRSLEEGIMNYPGCVLVTSHDRWFLDRLATHILAYEGNGHVEWFEGNFEEYEKDKIRRLGEDACNPHAMKYKPLER